MPIRCANNVHAEADNGISLEQKKKIIWQGFWAGTKYNSCVTG